MGFKPGQLIVKGDGSTPVIASPTSPAIDWSRYRRMIIRMIVEGGREIKIRFGDREERLPLAPPMEWRDYNFELPTRDSSSFTRRVAIMPTDDLYATVAIDAISLVPRESKLEAPAGAANIGKGEEYRNVLFARAPSSITYEVPVPPAARLYFGLGVASSHPVTFRILAGVEGTELFSSTLRDPERWTDASVDLSKYAGKAAKIVFRTESAAGGVGFWANPLLASGTGARRLNVLLYVVCTLRAGHTSLYGYARDTTPFLKRLGSSAAVFEDAQAQASWTKPSVASLMTSLHAYTHGLVNDTDTIPQGAPTLAGELRKAGWVTAAIVANPFAGRTSGLDRGFDFMMEYPVVMRHRDERVDRGTDSAAINRAIAPWLDSHRGQPFFLFVQSTDPHAPYRPPAEYEARFASPVETQVFNHQYARLRDVRAYGGGATVTPEEIRARGIDPAAYAKQAIDRYDAEIANNDRNIELLIGKLKELGVLDNTLVVVASDHGEEFWEHGLGAHGHSLYSELIHAVLLMWNPPRIPTPRRVAEPVQLIDVMPTILDLAGAPAPSTMQGQSLVPLLRGEPFVRKQPIYSSKLALPRAKPGTPVKENLTDTFARIDAGWKVIYRQKFERAGLREIEMYRRKTDPGDQQDVASAESQTAAARKAEILAWIQQQQQIRQQLGPGGQSKIDRQNLERLRSLGYLGGKK
jgi:arylsulfatase A-like enzyme